MSLVRVELLAWVAACAVSILAVVVSLWRTRRREDRDAEANRIIEGVVLAAAVDDHLDATGILGVLNNTGDWVSDRLAAVITRHGCDVEADGPLGYQGRHHMGVAAGSVAQVDAFDAIIASLFDTRERVGLAELVAAWECWHCQISDHAACPGCSCVHAEASDVRS